MVRKSLRCVSLFVSLALAVPAMAYNVVNVSAPLINCVFSTTCSVGVQDMVSSIPNTNGGKIQSRRYMGQPGSTAAGKYVYEYRIIMTNSVGIVSIPYVSGMRVYAWGVPLPYDYDFDGIATDHVFVTTSGGIGSKGLSGAPFFWGYTYFNLSSPVYGGGSPGTGESSYFFGLTSDKPPIVKDAFIVTDSGTVTAPIWAPAP